ncbi:MAG: peptide deformylase [Candidatus Cloacimonetes bacterium]|nr:peptide deformylase [Candidatus Cloacimonadota bacterium]
MKNKRQLLKIRIYGDKTLNKVAEPVKEITPEIQEFIQNLTHTMYIKNGIGLAAPQVGISLRIYVVDPFWYKEGKKKNPYIFINPEFLEFEGESTAEEGCLSLPDIFEKVSRAEKVVITAMNENGKKITLEAEGIFARVLQHEFDHLGGILFVEKISKLRQVFIKKKLRELAKSTDENGENIQRIED